MRSAISWALLRRSTRYRPAWLRPLPPAPGAAGQSQRVWPRDGPREPRRGGEEATAQASGARRTCRGFLRLQPPSPVAESGPGWVGGTCAPAWTAAGGKLHFRALRLPNCSLALGKVSYPSPSPTLPFFSPLWRLGCACSSKGLRGCPCRDETFAAGNDCLSARARTPFPSLPPRAPQPPSPPQNLRCAEEPRITWGEGPGPARRTKLDLVVHKCCSRKPLGSFFSRVNYCKAPRPLRRVNNSFALALSSLILFLHHRPARSADLKSEQLESNEFSGTATPTDTQALPSRQRLPALSQQPGKNMQCRPFKHLCQVQC